MDRIIGTINDDDRIIQYAIQDNKLHVRTTNPWREVCPISILAILTKKVIALERYYQTIGKDNPEEMCSITNIITEIEKLIKKDKSQ
jgi:hypothetical protein